MIQELIYTSLENGLLPGTRGFSTVAMTQDMSIQKRQLLESLSGYTHLYTSHDAAYLKNPVVWSHLISQQGESILSRVGAHDFDYTGRTNKLAHHLLLTGEKTLPACGPASLLRYEDTLLDDWLFDPTYLEKDRIRLSIFKNLHAPSPRANTWGQTSVGEKGAAALAQFIKNSVKSNQASTLPAYIVFDPEDPVDLLLLVEEACALLTPDERWQVTFSTYFTTLPIGMRCDWRFCLKDESTFIRQRDRTLWIDLTSGKIHNDDFDYQGLLRVAVTGTLPYVVITPRKEVSNTLIDIDLENPEEKAKLPRRRYKLVQKQNQVPTKHPQTFNTSDDHQVKKDHLNDKMAIFFAVFIVVVACLSIYYLLYQKNQKIQNGQKDTGFANETRIGVKAATATSLTSNAPSFKPISDKDTKGIVEKANTNQEQKIKHMQAKDSDTSNNTKETSSPDLRSKSDPPKIGNATTINYKHEFILNLTNETEVPLQVATKKEAENKKCRYYGLRWSKDNRSWKTEEGEYMPAYPNAKRGATSPASCKVSDKLSRDPSMYDWLLFEIEKATVSYQYLYSPHNDKPNGKDLLYMPPVKVIYPLSEISFPELNNIPTSFREAFNKLMQINVMINLGNADSEQVLIASRPVKNILIHMIEFNYKKAFDKKVNKDPTLVGNYIPEYKILTTEINEKHRANTKTADKLKRLKNRLKNMKPKDAQRKKQEERIQECEAKKKNEEEGIREVKNQRDEKLNENMNKVPIWASLTFDAPSQNGGSQ